MKGFLGKKICILGLGVENYALLEYMQRTNSDLQDLDISICDSRDLNELEARSSNLKPDVRFKLGRDYDKNLDEYDIILRSPGYPLFKEEIKKAQRKGVVITSPMKLFLEICPTDKLIGVTGSKGKGTTASLICDILKKAGKKVFLGGNIGTPPFGFLPKIKKSDWVVLELSSFQLEDMDRSPKIAVITNLFREHLTPADPNNPNYHRSMNDYWRAKANIFRHQDRNCYLVINEKLKSKKEKIKHKGKTVYFSRSELLSKLKGEHNKENIAAAVKVAAILNINNEVVKKAVKDFKGLPHRLEKISAVKGVEYYDDSFATTPEASIIALRSFEKPVILLAGGADKGADFSEFAREIEKRVKHLILFKGEGTTRLTKALKKRPKARSLIPRSFVGDMKEAVKEARKQADTGDVVLLSTGCASFGIFKNYKQRGEFFEKEIKKTDILE